MHEPRPVLIREENCRRLLRQIDLCHAAGGQNEQGRRVHETNRVGGLAEVDDLHSGPLPIRLAQLEKTPAANRQVCQAFCQKQTRG